MFRYIVDVHHRDRYEFDASMANEAIKIAKDCAIDNYGSSYVDRATFDVIRIDIPTVGDATDAGVAGE
jgi:hypothetical protein